jgi:hypothetical protein
MIDLGWFDSIRFGYEIRSLGNFNIRSVVRFDCDRFEIIRFGYDIWSVNIDIRSLYGRSIFRLNRYTFDRPFQISNT